MRKDLYEDLYITEETHWWHKAKRRFVNQAIAIYAQKKKLTILDVGCGTGKNMEELRRFGDVWGVDVSDEAHAFCKKRGLTQVKKGEVERLPFERDIFDVVCILDVLEHVDDRATIKEIKRVLKNDGLIVITVPAFWWLWSKWDKILHHKRRYTKKQLEEILTAEGFVIKRNSYIHSFLVLPILMIRKIKQLQKKSYSSDFQINNALINMALSFVSHLEQMWITRYDMPFGTSILCVAQNRKEKSASPL